MPNGRKLGPLDCEGVDDVGANPRETGRLVHPDHLWNLPHCCRLVCVDDHTAKHNTDANKSVADKCCDIAAATTATVHHTSRAAPAFGTENANDTGQFTRTFRSPIRQQHGGQADFPVCVARSWHADNGCERAASVERGRTGSRRGSRPGCQWRWRRWGRPPCVPKMPGMPFNGCRQESAGSFARGHHQP